MKSRQRKVIILKNLNSPHIEQAFFVLKDGCEGGRNAVFEAEKIVEEYIFPSMVPEKQPPKLPEFLPLAVTAAIAVVAGVAAILINIV